jgi:ubiquinone/menaquinone biosynthesis C-methylase UbiE
MNDNRSEPATNPTGNCGTDAAMCCANFYEQDIIQELMGGSFHPGGEALSRRLVGSLQLSAGENVLDVACGVGTTSRMMANMFGLNATGLDFSEINVQKAQAAAAGLAEDAPQPCCDAGEPCCDADEGLTQLGGVPTKSNSVVPGELKFVQGSADGLPQPDSTFDGVTCECAVSTFADQAQAAAEFYRVLKPGGVFGMTDMVLNGDLPDDFAEKAAPWTCVAKALTIEGYRALFEQAGFQMVTNEDHSDALLELATDMKRKLVMAGMGKALGALPSLGLSLSEMRAMLSQSTELVKAGTIQYGLLVFKKSS